MEESYCNPDMCITVNRERREVEVVSWGIRAVIRGFEEVEITQRGVTKVVRATPKA